MQDWKLTKLSEIVTLLGDGIHGTPKYTDNGEYYFINGNNLIDGEIIIKSDTKRVSKDEYLKHKRNLNDRTLLVSINGTIGKVAYYKQEKVMLGKSACYFNIKEGVSKGFIKQIISSKYFTNYLETNSTGSVIKNVSLKSMRDFPISLPSLQEQKVIASILSALDDKIELNIQINKTLDEMGKSLYRHWFVEFSPFKSGKFVDSEWGRVPEGWEVAKFGDLIEKIIDNRGKTPPISNVKTDYLLLETYQLSRDSIFPKSHQENKAKYITDDVFKSEKWFRKGHPKFMDILFATVGNGIPNWSFMYENNGVGIAQNVVAIRTKPNIPSEFLRYSFESNMFLDQFDGYIITTAQPSIKLSDLNMINMILPTNEVLTSWHSVVGDYVKQIYSNVIENQTLITLRDTLLPKLISGEVRVKYAEQMVAEAL